MEDLERVPQEGGGGWGGWAVWGGCKGGKVLRTLVASELRATRHQAAVFQNYVYNKTAKKC